MTADLIRKSLPWWKACVPFPAPGSYPLHRVPPAALCSVSPSSTLPSPRARRGEEKVIKKKKQKEENSCKQLQKLIEAENKSPSLIPFHLF